MRKPPSTRSSAADAHANASVAASSSETAAATPITTTAAPVDAVSALRDERVKKSVAHRHTTFLRLALDNRGKQHEKRVCSYCPAVFSFKSGTTSAALRHLKAAHLEHVSSDIACTATSKAKRLKARTNGKRTATAASVAVSQRKAPQSASEHITAAPASLSTGPAPHTAESDTINIAATTSNSSSRDDAVISFIATLPESSGASITAADADVRQVAEALLQESLPRQQQQPGADRRKRGFDEIESDSTGNTSTGTAGELAAPLAHAATHVPPPALLTASQTAITHFLRHYKDMLAPVNRLRFVKHVTHHPREAEMYNVLDGATQIEYIKEFADPRGTS